MTDKMVLNNIFKRKPLGKEFILETSVDKLEKQVDQPNERFYSFFHKHRLNVFYTLKSIMWNLSRWKNDNLKNFLLNFNPDIVFAPCYGNTFMLKLTRFVSSSTNKAIISYISDDSYSLKQFNFSPFYWINRFAVRRQLRKTFPYYPLVYTMTKIQKEQCEKVFHANTKILLKSVDVSSIKNKNSVNSPIKLIYAGGLYLNRWKTLASLVSAINSVNLEQNKKVFELNIYTGSEITSRMCKKLETDSSFIYSSISLNDLQQIYSESDIALHVESFSLKNRLAVRMSFSTKITDCLSSGCAVMAICDSKQGGFDYLKKNDAAICVSNKKDIKHVLISIMNDSNIVCEYAKKAKECCANNHDSNIIHKEIVNDFVSLSGVK